MRIVGTPPRGPSSLQIFLFFKMMIRRTGTVSELPMINPESSQSEIGSDKPCSRHLSEKPGLLVITPCGC